ncbi:MAG: T9SS type A sorting domain-containing protein [Crocinitomicaceae bacterium]
MVELHYKRISTLLLFLICFTSTSFAFCPFSLNGGLFGSGAAPTPGNSTTVQTCSFVGEATAATGVVAGEQYTVNVTYLNNTAPSITPFVVIYDSATATIITSGLATVTFTAPTSGTYYSIPFADAFCTNVDPFLIDGDPNTSIGCNVTLWSNVTPFPPPPNDLPCNATVLAPEATCSYTIFTNAHATAAPGVPPPGCAGYLGGDIWFTTTIPPSGIVLIDTDIGGVIDGGMAVYTGSCGSLTPLECDNDDSGNGAMPQIEIGSLAPGTQIWIRFWEVGNNSNGEFGICVTEVSQCGVPLTNDYCESPTPISQGPGTLSGTTSATHTADMPGNVNMSFCGSIENNSWYRFTALSTTETFNFTSVTNCINDPSNGAGVQAAVYEVISTPEGCCDALNIRSNCYSPANFSLGTVTASSLTIGNSYVLMIDGFSGDVCDWSIANWVAEVLPVELSEFYGLTLTQHNALRWETASEMDNDYFNVLRSYDGESFELIGEVAGVGYSQETNYYQFNDPDVRSGLVYYQLEQVDFDGHREKSEIIALNRESNQSGLIAAYPNPTTGEITTEVNGADGISGVISVTDMNGTLIEQKIVYTLGIEKHLFDLSKYETGMYFVRYQDDSSDHTIKLIKQ